MADIDPTPAKKSRARRLRPAQEETLDATEIAMKAVAAEADRESPACIVLEKHSKLIDIQCHVLRLQEVTRWLMLAAMAAVVVGIASLVWTASRASGLVIHAFSVPPDLEQRGLSGEAVASQLLDRVRRLDQEVVSLRAPSSYANEWTGRITVEIPNTGISIGDLTRHMRDWLGSETPVTGEIFRQEKDLSISVRVGTGAGVTFSSLDARLEPLFDRAAEAIFHAGQPYRYAMHLRSQRRWNEAMRVLQDIASGPDLVERPWGYVGIGQLLQMSRGDQAAYPMFVRAVLAGPDNPVANVNLAVTDWQFGRRQAATDNMHKAAQLIEGGRAKHIRKEGRLEFTGIQRGMALVAAGDYGAATDALVAVPAGSFIEDRNYWLALAQVGQHRPRVARTLMIANGPARVREGEFAWEYACNRAEALAAAAAEQQDWAAVLREMEAFERLAATSPRGRLEAARLLPLHALALARLGRIAEAQTLIANTPPDCYSCLITRGWIEALSGNTKTSDRWFTEAVRQGPRLPVAQTEWGRALLARSETERAMAMLSEAIRVQPRFPDSFKYSGDALGRTGKHREAIRRYSAAAERAPHWGALHVDWGIALWRLGRIDEAREKWRAAAAMDLSAGDRARLQRIWAAANKA